MRPSTGPTGSAPPHSLAGRSDRADLLLPPSDVQAVRVAGRESPPARIEHEDQPPTRRSRCAPQLDAAPRVLAGRGEPRPCVTAAAERTSAALPFVDQAAVW